MCGIRWMLIYICISFIRWVVWTFKLFKVFVKSAWWNVSGPIFSSNTLTSQGGGGLLLRLVLEEPELDLALIVAPGFRVSSRDFLILTDYRLEVTSVQPLHRTCTPTRRAQAKNVGEGGKVAFNVIAALSTSMSAFIRPLVSFCFRLVLVFVSVS